jgi:hypothetical protein
MSGSAPDAWAGPRHRSRLREGARAEARAPRSPSAAAHALAADQVPPPASRALESRGEERRSRLGLTRANSEPKS